MAFNKYQWELYLKSNGKETVQHFQDFLDGKFEGYPEFIKKLVSGYCPDALLIDRYYESTKWAIDSINKNNIEQNASSKEMGDNSGNNNLEPTDPCKWLEDDWNNFLNDNSVAENWKAFGTYIFDVIDYTQILSFYEPRVFFPYYFQQIFNVLFAIADMFEIELPPIPEKTQYRERIKYYGLLCNKFIDFANENSMSDVELWAFLYDYGPSCVGGTSWIVNDIPTPRNIFVFGYGPFYPEKEPNKKWICQGNPDMQIGDIGLLYHWAPDKCYTSVWRAISPGFYDPLACHDRYVCYGYPIEIPRVSFSDLRKDQIFKETTLVKQNMLRMDGAPMLPSEYMHLLEMAKKKGPIPENVPLFELKTDISKTELLVERDVEEQLLEPFLLRLGWKPENWCRQMPVRIGRGISKYPDYVIHPVYTKNHERGEIVLEAKLSIPNNKQLEVDRGQAHSYAKLLTANAYVLVAKEGIWIATKDDDFESIAGYLWKELEDTDTFSKISKIIGNQQKNKQKRKNSTTGD